MDSNLFLNLEYGMAGAAAACIMTAAFVAYWKMKCRCAWQR